MGSGKPWLKALTCVKNSYAHCLHLDTGQLIKTLSIATELQKLTQIILSDYQFICLTAFNITILSNVYQNII